MKLLVVVNNLLPKTNANTNIVYRLADELWERYGDEILLLGTQTADQEEGTDVLYPTWQIPTVYEYQKKIPETLGKKEKLLRVMMHPGLWEFRLRRAVDRYPLQRQYRRYLKKILRSEKDIDCVLCVSCPHDTIHAAARVVRGIPLASYQLDPWSTNLCYQGNPRVKMEEARALARCSAAFITKEMERERREGVYTPPLDTIVPLEFPCLLPPPVAENRFAAYGDSKIHCAYVGQLYSETVRGPGFLFSLFQSLEKYGIILHIIGNSEVQAQQYRDQLPQNIILHGRVSPQEAKAYMASADILVNMGNTIPNMLPSKTIDYISCGKPILNLCKIPNCPTIPYMEKYPLSMVFLESESISAAQIKRVATFCTENKGRSLSYAEVRDVFYECTPEYVAKRIHTTLQNIIAFPQHKTKSHAHRICQATTRKTIL